jgi:hypothetical protein
VGFFTVLGIVLLGGLFWLITKIFSKMLTLFWYGVIFVFLIKFYFGEM